MAGVRDGSVGEETFPPTAKECSGTYLCKAKEEQTEETA